MNLVKEICLLAILSFIGAVATHFYHPQAPAWYVHQDPAKEGEVTMSQIHSQWNDEVLWIDARSREDFEKEHIPNAILLNEAEVDALLFEHFDRIQSNEKPIVIYCNGLSCEASHRMRDYLKERIAIDQIFVLRGGWDAWKEHLQTHPH